MTGPCIDWTSAPRQWAAWWRRLATEKRESSSASRPKALITSMACRLSWARTKTSETRACTSVAIPWSFCPKAPIAQPTRGTPTKVKAARRQFSTTM
ncbi:hypothetical protein D3C78_1468790 [compost metagenome]